MGKLWGPTPPILSLLCNALCRRTYLHIFHWLLFLPLFLSSKYSAFSPLSIVPAWTKTGLHKRTLLFHPKHSGNRKWLILLFSPRAVSHFLKAWEALIKGSTWEYQFMSISETLKYHLALQALQGRPRLLSSIPISQQLGWKAQMSFSSREVRSLEKTVPTLRHGIFISIEFSHVSICPCFMIT